MKPLKKILDELAAGRLTGYLSMSRPLAKNVTLVQLWPEYKMDDLIPVDLLPRTIYLLQEETAILGAVEPLDENLLAIMLPAWRGKGIFSKAMRATILPHILQNKPMQRLQLQRSEYGDRKADLLKKIALSLGFILLKDEADIRMVIDGCRRPAGRFVGGEDQPVSGERKAAIKKELSYIGYRLTLIRSELELTEGISYFSDALGDIIKSLRSNI